MQIDEPGSPLYMPLVGGIGQGADSNRVPACTNDQISGSVDWLQCPRVAVQMEEGVGG